MLAQCVKECIVWRRLKYWRGYYCNARALAGKRIEAKRFRADLWIK